MLSQREIYTTAQILLDLHGEMAEKAVQVALLMSFQQEDIKIAATWLSVGHAINQLTLKQHASVH